MASDLESTYRVMRCFMMLKSNPERLEGLRTFIAKCRNEDGGYGVAPGQPSSAAGTYYAASMTAAVRNRVEAVSSGGRGSTANSLSCFARCVPPVRATSLPA